MTTAEMPFLEHLRELRTRIIRILIGVGIGMLLALNWSEECFYFLSGPVRTSFANSKLIGTGPTDAFIIKLKVAAFAGIILSCPLSFLQIWRFISPGMYEHERKLALPFVFFASLFFLLGLSFCFFIVLPYAFTFFAAEYESLGVAPDLRVHEYLSFALGMCVVFGVTFELPVLSFFLSRIGILSSRMLLSNFRFIIVGIFIAAAILTPPDVVSQVLLAAPLLVLYGLCILVVKAVEIKKGRVGVTDTAFDSSAL